MTPRLAVETEPAEAHVIAQVCWMVDVKGVQTLLRAFALLAPGHPKAHLLCVGEGPKLAEPGACPRTEDCFRRHFHRHAQQPHRARPLSGDDIFTQLSVWQEACGLAVLEAMSAAVPVVATRVGALPEIVRHDESGLLVEVDDAHAACRALTRLLDDPSLRCELGQAGLHTAGKSHRIEHTSQRYVEVFLGAPSSLALTSRNSSA